jgi:hypothetical protein
MIAAITKADREQDAEIFAVMFENPDVIDGFVKAAMAHVRHMHESGNAPLFAEIRAESMRNDAIDLCCREAMDAVTGAFGRYLQGAIDRGEIDPAVGLDQLMPMIAAIGEGLAINDLPGNGVSSESIEIMIRVTVEAILRPRRRV